MWHNAHDAYRESNTLSADPLELVRMLYHGAIESIRNARRHLANKEIRERARAISKASQILLELTASLDFERGGEIAPRLAGLYQYMLRRLTEANFKQSDEPLAEVLGLMTTLLEGWEGILKKEEPTPVAASPWGPAIPQDTVASSVHAWSF